ncbi:MAG: CYTH domain-containing protein, partial [Myxococcota bacterium]
MDPVKLVPSSAMAHMACMSNEIELKVRVEDLPSLERLTTRLGKRVARVEQANLYFETEDDALRRAGWSVRVRAENEQVRLTLKGQPRSDGDFVIRSSDH